MANENDRSVFRRADGQWVNKRNDADKVSSLHTTQAEANAAAKEMLKRAGGGDRIRAQKNRPVSRAVN